MSPRFKGFPEVEKATAEMLRKLADAIEAGEARLVEWNRASGVHILPGIEVEVEYMFKVTRWESS